MIHCVICVKGVEDTKLERCQAMITLTMQCNNRMCLIQHLNPTKTQTIQICRSSIASKQTEDAVFTPDSNHK